MTNGTIPMLPLTLHLTGAEYLEAVQAGMSVRVTSAQLGALAPTIGPVGSFNRPVTATVPSGVTDNYAPVGYAPGTTNMLILTPTDGTSTLSGLVSAGAVNGFSLLIWNASATLPLKFNNQASGTPANTFACPGAGVVSLPPFAKVLLVYIGGQWTL
jgi:hypothetical protein